MSATFTSATYISFWEAILCVILVLTGKVFLRLFLTPDLKQLTSVWMSILANVYQSQSRIDKGKTRVWAKMKSLKYCLDLLILTTKVQVHQVYVQAKRHHI